MDAKRGVDHWFSGVEDGCLMRPVHDHLPRMDPQYILASNVSFLPNPAMENWLGLGQAILPSAADPFQTA
jgi:hypothetical protein